MQTITETAADRLQRSDRLSAELEKRARHATRVAQAIAAKSVEAVELDRELDDLLARIPDRVDPTILELVERRRTNIREQHRLVRELAREARVLDATTSAQHHILAARTSDVPVDA